MGKKGELALSEAVRRMEVASGPWLVSTYGNAG